MAVVIEVLCEGHTHRLEFRDDGTFHMLDHEEIDVRAFVAFGAKPPGCLIEIDKARENSVRFLVVHLGIDQKAISLLACDFAERVLPIWYEYYPDDHRPREAIEAVREYLAGKINKSALEIAREAVSDASWTAWTADEGGSGGGVAAASGAASCGVLGVG